MSGVVSICPKCGREGRQNIYSKVMENGMRYTYLRFMHRFHEECYIGRIKSGGEGMGEFDRPQSLEDYEKAMNDIAKEIRELAKYYSTGSAIRWKIVAPKLLRIIEKYGY